MLFAKIYLGLAGSSSSLTTQRNLRPYRNTPLRHSSQNEPHAQCSRDICWSLSATGRFPRILKNPCASKENRFPKLNLPTVYQRNRRAKLAVNKQTPVHGRFCHRTGVFCFSNGVVISDFQGIYYMLTLWNEGLAPNHFLLKQFGSRLPL